MIEEHLIREFIAEVEEHLLVLEPGLLRLEKEPDSPELLQDIFLATHSIKGTASYVGLSHISHFTHTIESLLDRLRKQEIRASSELIDTLLEGLDMLKLLVTNVSLGKSAPDTSAIERKLTQWHEQSTTKEEYPQDRMKLETRNSKLERQDQEPVASQSPSPIFDPLTFQIDPEDWEIFADIAHQQIEFMRLALETIRQLSCEQPEVHSEQLRPPVEAFANAFRTFQSSAGILNVDVFNQYLKQPADDVAKFSQPTHTLTAQDLSWIEDIIRNLEQITNTISESLITESEGPDQPVQSAPPTAEPLIIDTISGQHTLRVNAERIDYLLNLIGELVINRARLTQVGTEIRTIHEDLRAGEGGIFDLEPTQRKKATRIFKKLKDLFDEISLDLGRLTNQLQEGTMRIRMIPLSQVVSRFPRMVRDLSRQAGKEVEIEIYGADTELDKTVMDIIGDPLIHLVRNAIDHGIETPEERLASGKSHQGTIKLSACHQGNQVVIEVADDGRGIDVNRVKEKALQQHLITPKEINTLQTQEIAALIFHPGFSTLDTASPLSGRGVGLHIVKRYLEKLNGAIELETTPVTGSKFTIRLPLTLAIIPALMVGVKSEIFAIPLVSVEEAVRITAQDIKTIESHQVIRLRERMIPLLDLADLLGSPVFGARKTPSEPGTGKLQVPFYEEEKQEKFYGVIISDGLREIGLIVDTLVGESDIVIKSLSDELVNVEGISGASIQGDGRVALVLDATAIIDLASKRFRRTRVPKVS
jgi:two-component system chemotaxis sensor kinase CheA